MGQTDKQFKAFLRQILRDLKRAQAAPTFEDAKILLGEMIEDMQHSIED